MDFFIYLLISIGVLIGIALATSVIVAAENIWRRSIGADDAYHCNHQDSRPTPTSKI